MVSRIVFAMLVALVAIDGKTVFEGLRQEPPPDPNFDPVRFLGLWYMPVFIPPASWPGARLLDNVVWNITLQNDGNFKSFVTWRRDENCVGGAIDFPQSSTPGTVLAEDSIGLYNTPGTVLADNSIGGLLDGDAKVVMTDFDNFEIGWGCTKRGVTSGLCDYPWLEVKTRSPKPSERVLNTVFRQICRLFGIKRKQISLMDQSRPCASDNVRIPGAQRV